jgi:alpha-beta hydrolase superfamily lysophospholipase
MAALWILPAIVLIYFTVCFIIFKMAFGRQDDTSRAAIKESESGPFKEFNYLNGIAEKWLADNNAKEVSIKSFDGYRLSGRFVAHESPRATVVIVHGYHGNYTNSFALIFDLYKELGFNILMFRQRAHSESEGKYITFGALEHRDLLSWIDFHNQTVGDLPLFVSGISMGASTVMYAADKELPGNIRGMTADCGFTSPYDIILKVVSERIRMNAKFLMPGVNLFCKLLAGFDMKEFSSEKTLKNAKAPILMIHGEDDDFVPCEMSRRGFEACSGEKYLVTVKGAAHGTSFLVGNERLRPMLIEFFNSHL